MFVTLLMDLAKPTERWQLWNDYQLEWDPTDFGGISVIRILSHKVWKPDIVLFNKYISSFIRLKSSVTHFEWQK